MDNVSKELCSLYKALQKKIKRFETMCETNHCTVFLNGLNGNGRIKLGLIGEFSSGKTTLVRRIFESYSGKESSVPETACLVVHKQDKFKNLTVKFNQTFTIKNNGLNKFEDFLEKNKLKGYVKKIENDTWESDSDDIPFFSESSEDVKAFFDEVDKYPNVISKIQWCHKKKYESEDCNILDFFEIYDVPGFDGGEEHKETIRQIMETESFDVIICLIETDKGVPTESVINELGEVVDKINNRNPNLIFYWGYEKGNVGKDYDPKASLNYINEAIEKILRKNPFKDAGLLDLTGEISDKERIDNALIKEVLSNYFQKGGECYLESQKSFFGRKREDVNFTLENIRKEINEKSMDKSLFQNDVELIIKEKLGLDFDIFKESMTKPNVGNLKTVFHEKTKTDENKKGYVELPEKDRRKKTMEIEKKMIINTCKDIVGFICPALNKYCVDRNKISANSFWDKYNKDVEWQILLERVIHYKMLKDFDSVKQYFLSSVGSDLYMDIGNDIDKIKKICEKGY